MRNWKRREDGREGEREVQGIWKQHNIESNKAAGLTSAYQPQYPALCWMKW